MRLPGKVLVLLVFFCLPILGGNLYAQTWEQLPKIQPTKISLLDEEKRPKRPCTYKVVKDQYGQLWLSTCGTYATKLSMPLLKFDGHRLASFDLPIIDSLPFNRSYLVQGHQQKQLWAYVWNQRNNIIINNLASEQQRTYIPFPPGVNHVSAVASNQQSYWGLWQDGQFVIYNLNKEERELKIDLETTIKVPETKTYLGGASLSYADSLLWIFAGVSPLYNYNPYTKQFDTIRIENLGGNLPIPLLSKSTKIAWQKDSLFIGLSGDLNSILRYEKGSNTIVQVDKPPKNWTLENLFVDDLERLLFLFRDLKNQLHLILQDNNGERFDLSDFISPEMTKINSISGQDFLSEFFIATSSGAYHARVSQLTGIKSYKSRSIRQIVELDDESLLFKIVPKTGLKHKSWRVLTNDSIQSSLLVNSTVLDSFVNEGGANAVILSPSGKPWMVSRDGLIEMNSVASTLSIYQTDGAFIKAYLINEDSLLYLHQSSRQLYLYDLANQKIQPFEFKDKPLILNPSLEEYHLNEKGILYLATSAGLYVIDIAAQKWQLLGYSDDFPDYRFLYVWEAPDQKLWLGSANSGVIVYDLRLEKVVQVIDREKGLTNNTVVSILPDSEGDLWVATFDGLNLLSADGEVLANIYEEDGLPHPEFNRNAYLKAKNGKLWFGTLEGLVAVDPLKTKAYLRQGQSTQLYVSKLGYYDFSRAKQVSLKTPDPSAIPIIKLSATRRNLSLTLGMSNYGYTDRNRFAYRFDLKGSDWQYLDQNHQLELKDLPPGRYKLLLKGIDHRGVWTEPVVLPLIVKDFFYRQPWFYGCILLLVAGLGIFWIRRLRTEKSRLTKEVQLRTKEILEDKEIIEKQAAELREVDEMKSRFFTNISHELRTPVTLIGTPLEEIIRRYSGQLEPDALQLLQLLQNNTKKLDGLVEEILELSRIESGRAKLKPSPVNIISFVEQLYQAFKGAAKQKQIDFKLESQGPAELSILIDRPRLAKIINNLLSNAMKFTPAGGQIILGVQLQAEKNSGDAHSLEIIVRDNGPGISKEDIPHLFDRYYQANKAKNSNQGGTGIGLALARESAHLMNGQLTVESELGKGASFRLFLPQLKSVDQEKLVASDQKTPSLSDPESPVLPTKKGKAPILIVEDNPDMQALLVSILADSYNCHLADNGQAAWDILQQTDKENQDWKLIISDIMMPLMDGYELLEKIKQEEQLQTIPVIMLTARSDQSDKLLALRLGVDDYLTKPFSVQELLARCENLIHRFQQRLAYQEELANDSEELPLSADQQWLDELEQAILAAIDKKIELNVNYLTNQINLGDRQLLRRLKALTGLSTNQYIQEIKLQKARIYLESRSFFTVSEVAYACGFNTPTYFSKLYFKRFGKKPTAYFEANA